MKWASRNLISTVIILAALLCSSACGKKTENGADQKPATPAQNAGQPSGLTGKYIAGIKHDDTTELYKLDISRQGNEVTGTLYFLTTMFDSIDDNPAKVDLQVFDSFDQRPIKLTGKANGDSLELTAEPLTVSNYIFNWHFTGQAQGDKIAGQLDEQMQTDDKDQPGDNPQKLAVTFTRAAGQ